MERKIIQIVSEGKELRALCNDGTLWRSTDSGWKPWTSHRIPQGLDEISVFYVVMLESPLSAIPSYLSVYQDQPSWHAELIQARTYSSKGEALSDVDRYVRSPSLIQYAKVVPCGVLGCL